MKVTALYVYPIKALRGIRLDEAHLTPQGVQYDRTFMLCRVAEDGELQTMQLSRYPECSLFAQEIIGSTIHVKYLNPNQPLDAPHPEQQSTLEVPLQPDLTELEKADINLHQSMVSAYRMRSRYDAWFSACFGFEIALLYIGNGKRPVLGTFSPKSQLDNPQKGWLSSISAYIPFGSHQSPAPDWLTFTDMAPFLVATEASLCSVSALLEEGDVEMWKFRPNIVVDGEAHWDEDFWAGLSVNGQPTLTMSKMCNRCASLNVDYNTGKMAEGERGTVLKKLMADRRVDPGWKYNPVFGRYAFLDDLATGTAIRVGDDVAVTEKLDKRPAFDWPLNNKAASRFYQAA